MKCFIFILSVMGSCAVKGQGVFKISLILPEELEIDKLNVFYDNGISEDKLKVSRKNGPLFLTGKYFSKYVFLKLVYPDTRKEGNKFIGTFFANDKPGVIRIVKSDSINPFQYYKLKNVLAPNELGKSRFDDFIKKEHVDFVNFIQKYTGQMNDSLASIAFEKSDKLMNKKTEFVIKNNSNYYSFWVYRREVVYNHMITPDSLTKIFNTFTESLKSSREGKEVKKIIAGLDLRKNQFIDNVRIKDINGDFIKIINNEKKYVLLNFWASWCAPCLKEISLVLDMKKKYSDYIDVVFVSADEDRLDFEKAVKKFNITGRHAFINDDLMKAFGAQVIPKVYLIKSDGLVLYNRNEEKDFKLEYLEKLIEKEISMK